MKLVAKYTIEQIEKDLQSPVIGKNKTLKLKKMLKKLKAEQNGNVISIEDLKSFKSLIIFITKKETKISLKEVMTALMNEKIIYTTERNKKTVITNALHNVITELERVAFEIVLENTDDKNFLDERRKETMTRFINKSRAYIS